MPSLFRQIREAEVVDLLRTKHQPPSWAFLSQVPNSTGGATRTADAIAMGLWRSRGMEVHGYEIKTHRSDWLRELKRPEKADLIAGYCDHFDVVAPPNIVKDGELPSTWGLLVVREHSPKAKGDLYLKRVITGKAIEPKPLDRVFVAALLRCVHSQLTGEGKIAEIKAAGYDEGFKDAQHEAGEDGERWEAKAKSLEDNIRVYERASGMSLRYGDPEAIGNAVRLVQSGGYMQRHHLGDALRSITSVAEALEKAIAEFPTKEQLREGADNTREVGP